MIPLGVFGKPFGINESLVGRVTFGDVEASERPDHVRVVRGDELQRDLSGYAAALVETTASVVSVPFVQSVSVGHLNNGDVVALDGRGYVRTLYRRGSAHNAIFATDRCNSFCLMCSQPPKNVDDQWRVKQNIRLIELIDPDVNELGITGGEPTLLKDGLIDIVAKCKERLPRTSLHILSNGRLFSYASFARKLGDVAHQDLMVGVPIYADSDTAHDYIVQARGAFDQTILGLLNLTKAGVAVEIRVVVHSLTAARLLQTAQFVYRNLTFASHVTFMGLEPMGFAVPNADLLWIDPWDYREQLEKATLFLAARGVSVSVYNHQLCTVPETIWPYCRQSISDWKNEYLPTCEECGARQACGGLFTSGAARRHSAHIRPLPYQ